MAKKKAQKIPMVYDKEPPNYWMYGAIVSWVIFAAGIIAFVYSSYKPKPIKLPTKDHGHKQILTNQANIEVVKGRQKGLKEELEKLKKAVDEQAKEWQYYLEHYAD